jgi:hypothetical protein
VGQAGHELQAPTTITGMAQEDGVARRRPTNTTGPARHAGPVLETVVSGGSSYFGGTTVVPRSRLMSTVVCGEATMFSMIVSPPTLNPRACAPAATGTVTGP